MKRAAFENAGMKANILTAAPPAKSVVVLEIE